MHPIPSNLHTRLLASGVCGFPVVHTSSRMVEPMEKSPIRRLLSRGNTSPLHNFGHFFRCVPLGTLHPRLAASDASVFSFPWRRLRCAAPVTHQDQGLVTSRCCARRLPLASSMPQKTLGSLPCPIVYSVQIAWLPHGSNFNRAHGRGVANSTIRQQAICHRSEERRVGKECRSRWSPYH